MNLITGATGFIGRYLALRLIREGEPVRVLCRPGSVGKLDPLIASRAEIARGDLRDLASIESAAQGARRIFHCAGHVSDWGSEQDFRSTNVQGLQWLLESATGAHVRRFVHLSSIAVFGVPSPSYFDDETPYGPGRDLYSRTKIEGEKLALSFQREKGVPVTVLRPSVVYGRHGTWFEEPIRMARRNKMFLIGSGSGTCHPCYIENLVDALLLVADREEAIGQSYIIGDDEPISFRQYFNYLSEIAGKGPVRRSIPLGVARAMATAFETAATLTRSSVRPLLTHTAIDMVCASSRMSMAKIRNQLGYTPRFSVGSAMNELRAMVNHANIAGCIN